jgi:phosphoglycolate phosphatase
MTARTVAAVLFDLDGTLIDTAGDLLGALDDLLIEMGLPVCASTLPAALAARGGRGIIACGFRDDPDAPDRYLARYLELYEARIAQCSRPYAGIEEMLSDLADRGIQLGIVTNKPEALARRLLAELGWQVVEREGGAPAPLLSLPRANADDQPRRSAALPCFDVLVGGDTLSVRKPAPEPIWHACSELGIEPDQTLMVGDDLRDIDSGKAAGCLANFAVAYGYVEDAEAIVDWGADRVVGTPAQLASELLAWAR